MKLALEMRLQRRFPSFLRDLYADDILTPMHCGIRTWNGWYQIIHDAIEKIEKLAAEGLCGDDGEPLKAIQIKQKMGWLRIYTNARVSDPILEITSEAEERSKVTCEFCGKPGSLHQIQGGSWVFTACEEHSTKAVWAGNPDEVADLTEPKGVGYRCYWIAPTGEIIPCEYHLAGAMEVLEMRRAEGQSETEFIGSVYEAMYRLGCLRVALEEDKITYSHGSNSLPVAAWWAFQRFADKHRLPIYDERGKLQGGNLAQGRREPKK